MNDEISDSQNTQSTADENQTRPRDSGDGQADSRVRTRRRRRTRDDGDAQGSREGDTQAAGSGEGDTQAAGSGEGEGTRKRSRRGRRGRGGSGGGGKSGPGSGGKDRSESGGKDTSGSGSTEKSGSGGKSKSRSKSRSGGKSGSGAKGRSGSGGKSDAASDGDSAGGSDDDDQVTQGGTRVTAKQQGRGGRGRRGGGRGGSKPGAVPDEVRRAMLQSPPRTMLVSDVGERVQIAVLEDRTLVEHYVARADERSYVGNIYMGRVQNVLPGMEAAFLDIGKGRNGVLYAGEVLYDEQDLENDQPPRIEETLKPGQTVLVQVTKDPMGHKGARLTQHLSLAGRYMVLAPNSEVFGISRKLPDDARDRLRRILRKVKPDEHGVIVRTAAEEADEESLTSDLERLLRRWEHVQGAAGEAKALEPVYEEPALVVRTIRDHFSPDFERLVVDSPGLYEQVRRYLEEVAPELVDKLELYQPETAEGGDQDDDGKSGKKGGAKSGGDGREQRPKTLFEAYHVAEQLRKALEKKVWLPSGGYLIIEKTEAMTIIDVNTGKYTGSSSLEETVLRTNLEAAEEVVRQLRLRDIGGIIIIDFIDMLLKANQDEVIRRLKRELLRDRTKTRVSEVSRLGLVQMTRKNVSQGLVESFSERCDKCDGHGYVIHADW